ncbi:MAG: HisA/HisF-related TIM barrel protein [Ardenticatenaceae bacterium]
MIVFPALDLRQGLGLSGDPVALALRWADEGARWLHVVNLDGAAGEASQNRAAMRRIVQALESRGVSIQFGGGLRTIDEVDEALGWGVARVVVDTAFNSAEFLGAAVTRHGADRIVADISARAGKVVVAEWQTGHEVAPLDLARRLKELGIKRIVYTDIARVGTQQGADIARLGELAQKSGLYVIAAGGIGSPDHLIQLRWIEPYGVEGVIVRRALYEGSLKLRGALESLRQGVGLEGTRGN